MPQQSADLIAKLLNLTERRVRQLAQEGIIPKPTHGKYDLVGCVRGYVRHLRQRATNGETDVHAERGRLLKAQADRVELEVRELRARLVPVEDLGRALEFFATSVRSRLLVLPRKLAIRISPENPKDVEAKLEVEVHAILQELASDETLPDWLTESGRDGAVDREAGLETATEGERERVGRAEHTPA